MCMHWFNSQINKEKKIIFCINLQTKKKNEKLCYKNWNHETKVGPLKITYVGIIQK